MIRLPAIGAAAFALATLALPTFALTHDSIPSDAAAARLAQRKLAVWSGDYYALEVMQQLGLPNGAVRVGLVHYNTEQEVDRLLEGLAEL